MAKTTKKLTAGLLMAATTFTAGSTCFANQVGFFNDGTGCETAECYREVNTDMSCANSIFRVKVFEQSELEYDLMKKYYPEVFEKMDSAQKSIRECADDDCVRANFEKVIDAAKQYKKKAKGYLNNLNDENRSELAERGLANMAFYHKLFRSDWAHAVQDRNQDKLWVEFNRGVSGKSTEFYLAGNFNRYMEAEKAIYDYYKNTAAELGFDTSVSHKELIAQLKECDSDMACHITKSKIKLPTNNVLKTQNFYCAEPISLVEATLNTIKQFVQNLDDEEIIDVLPSLILWGTILYVTIGGALLGIFLLAGEINPVFAAVVSTILMPIVLSLFIIYEFVKIGAKYKI